MSKKNKQETWEEASCLNILLLNSAYNDLGLSNRITSVQKFLVLCQNLYVASIIGVAISRLPQADREIGFPMLDMTLEGFKLVFLPIILLCIFLHCQQIIIMLAFPPDHQFIE